MSRATTWMLVATLVAGPALLAAAGTAAYGTMRREAIRAVNACRNLATVSGQMNELAADVESESKQIHEGSPGRIAVVRERLEVLEGKAGELERKTAELQELAASIKAHATELQQPDVQPAKESDPTPEPQ